MNYIKTEKLKIYNIDKFETNIKNLEDTCPKLKFEFDYYIQQIKFIQNMSSIIMDSRKKRVVRGYFLNL